MSMIYKPQPTLAGACSAFIRIFLEPEVIEKSDSDPEIAKKVLKTMTAFNEGAFWAAARLAQVYEDHPEYQSQGPTSPVLKVVLEIMEAHSQAENIILSPSNARKY